MVFESFFFKKNFFVLVFHMFRCFKFDVNFVYVFVLVFFFFVWLSPIYLVCFFFFFFCFFFGFVPKEKIRTFTPKLIKLKTI